MSSRYNGATLEQLAYAWNMITSIPGPVFCAYFDSGGEGVAYHDEASPRSPGQGVGIP